jgi:hypothetical protein
VGPYLCLVGRWVPTSVSWVGGSLPLSRGSVGPYPPPPRASARSLSRARSRNSSRESVRRAPLVRKSVLVSAAVGNSKGCADQSERMRSSVASGRARPLVTRRTPSGVVSVGTLTPSLRGAALRKQKRPELPRASSRTAGPRGCTTLDRRSTSLYRHESFRSTTTRGSHCVVVRSAKRQAAPR